MVEYLQLVEQTTSEVLKFKTLEQAENALIAKKVKANEAGTMVARLVALQEVRDIERVRDALRDQPEFEDEFIQVAARFSERNGISYWAWREFGVDAAVLKAAGIPGA